MAGYEQALGLFIVPGLFGFLILLALGVARKQLMGLVQAILSVNFTINGHTVYVFSVLAAINLSIMLRMVYIMQGMVEPEEQMQRTEYFKDLYRVYRNFTLNTACFILIFQINYCGHRYKQYARDRDALLEKKKAK